MSVTRRAAVKALAGGFPAIVRGQAARRPNVIFMMTDDQRWDAMSCAGNRILKTPNMDRLAAGGVRFTEAFVTNPLCSPSRGTILTGLHTHAHGVTTNGGATHYFKPGVVTYPQLLQQAGYYSAMIGKWHIATLPEGLGFDHWCILPGQGLYHDPVMLANRGGGRIRFRGYVDDIIMDNALETLRSRPKDKPFSLICNFKAPHRAWEPPARHEKALDNINIPPPSTFHVGLEGRPKGIRETDMQIADMPDFHARGVPEGLPREVTKVLNHQTFVKNYYRTIMGVDDNVGRLLDYLDQQGLAENTLVIYTGDNGFFLGEYGMFDKRLMYEPSIRVPMLLRYPAMVKAGQVDSEHMVLNNDVAHTILDYCGVARPAHMDHHGESWRDFLENRRRQWRESWMYEYMEYPGPHCAPKARGVRTRTQKLIHYIQQPQGHEFFDLVKDPEERHSRYDDPAMRADVERLANELERWRRLTNDDRSEDNTPAPECGDRMRPLGG
jgi:arylsulfatase A-like enzyme